nr:hypothetical protein [Halobacillus sp. Marseille-Q1614]
MVDAGFGGNLPLTPVPLTGKNPNPNWRILGYFNRGGQLSLDDKA